MADDMTKTEEQVLEEGQEMSREGEISMSEEAIREINSPENRAKVVRPIGTRTEPQGQEYYSPVLDRQPGALTDAQPWGPNAGGRVEGVGAAQTPSATQTAKSEQQARTQAEYGNRYGSGKRVAD